MSQPDKKKATTKAPARTRLGSQIKATNAANAKPDDDPCKCIKCNTNSDEMDETSMLQCDSCQGWECGSCLPYTEAELATLSRPEIAWKCDTCTKNTMPTTKTDRAILSGLEQTMHLLTVSVGKIEQTMTMIATSLENKADKAELDTVKVDMDTVKDRVSTMETKVEEIGEHLDEKIGVAISEASEIESRKLNITIGGIPEPTGETNEERQGQDEAAVKELLNGMDGPDEIVEAKRVGKREEDKPRILKVILPSMTNKGAILKKAHKLSHHEATKNIFIRPDLTPLQRVTQRQLHRDLYEKKQTVDDPENWRIDYRRGKIFHYQS